MFLKQEKIIGNKEATAYFYIIVAIEMSSFYKKPDTLTDKFYDPLQFRDFVSEQPRKKLLRYIVEWIEPDQKKF